MHKFIKEYFNLSNNEQKGIIGLLLIILFVFVGTRIFFMFQPAAEIPQDNTPLLAQFYTDSSNYASGKTDDKTAYNTKKELTYFKFNPNTASKSELESLGFSKKTADVLINFRNKGGKFYKKEDLKKVYGVNEYLYNQLEAYITIPEKEYKDSKTYTDNNFKEQKEYPTYNKKEKVDYTPVIVNINIADSTTLVTVKGIGPTYASRIIKYRDLLGGFIQKSQLKEVYGINEEVYGNLESQIIVEGAVSKINVNTATWKELVSHPYINSNMAGIITKYIKTNGKVNDLDKILNPNIFDQITIQKIKPYLSTE